MKGIHVLILIIMFACKIGAETLLPEVGPLPAPKYLEFMR